MSHILLTTVFFLGIFVFLYPLILGLIWSVGGLIYWLQVERKSKSYQHQKNWPKVTILVPCHNEEKTLEATVKAIKANHYPNYHVYLINDASTDNTKELINTITNREKNFTGIHIKRNIGKANALNYALMMINRDPITIVIDSDTKITKSSIKELVFPMISDPFYDVVTGNPFVDNKSTLLGKVQALEFSSIIGLIRRAHQLFLGRHFTVSGCFTAYKTKALLKVGGFSANTVTEDIDVTWKLQKEGFLVGFSPKAIAYIQVPVTLKELWIQRMRWALGGWHLLRQHLDIFTKWRFRRLWFVYVNFFISYIWALSFIFVTIVVFIMLLTKIHPDFFLSPISYTSLLLLVCLAQIILSIAVNSSYDSKLWKNFFFAPWYPIVFFASGR